MPHCLIRFDGHAVCVSHAHDAADELLTFLFRDIEREQVEEDSLDPGVTRFNIDRAENSKTWALVRNDTPLYRGEDLNGLGNILMGEALFNLIEHNDNGMAIHAGMVSGPRGAWLLPAESGSGKTSVTTWLLTRGFRYHTDELVILKPDDSTATPFTRPLNVKKGGLEAIGSIVDLDALAPDIRSSGMVTMIPHRLVNPDFQAQVPDLDAIIFPHYSSDNEPILQRLSGAEAGLELMRSNVIGRNLPGHGFADVVRLVRGLPSYRLYYRHFDDLEALFQALD